MIFLQLVTEEKSKSSTKNMITITCNNKYFETFLQQLISKEVQRQLNEWSVACWRGGVECGIGEGRGGVWHGGGAQ